MVPILSALLAHAAPAQDAPLTAEQVIADVDLAEAAYQRIHPGYTRYASAEDLAGAWQDIRDRGGMTVGELYLAVESVLTLIRCDHTKAELPAALREERKTAPVYLPVRWVWVEERGIIVDPGDTGLAEGAEIVAIDGVPLAERVAAVEGFIPYDGETVWSREVGISDSLEFKGGALDHFGALLSWPAPQVTLTLRSADGVERTETVNRITYPQLEDLRARSAPPGNFKDAVHFERIGETAGLLRVDTFVNYRDPVKPDTLYAPVFAAMADEGRDTLVLDLRSNGGGSGDAQVGLLSYLLDAPARLYTDMQVVTVGVGELAEHLWTWDSRALDPPRIAFRSNDDGTHSLRPFVDSDLKTIRPKRDAFDGRLILLTSHANSSASTILTAFLAHHRDALLIGEETGGSAEGPTAGLQFTLTLPHSDIRTRVPYIRYTTNVPDPAVGYGVSPDIAAPMTVEALRAGRDPALEAAQALLSEEE